jgi:glycosyltransferase involved in cell wall biosynthesis
VRALALIPAYDEAATIEAVVAGVRAAGLDALVVDDGSRDATGALAAGAGARVLRHERNRGKGAALASGFAWALERGYDAVLTLDADLQHDPREAPRFLERAARGPWDVLCGTRMRRRRGMPFVRWATNACMSNLISLVAGVRLTDTQCGYKLLTRRALALVPLEAERFDVESEILLRAAEAGLRIGEVPVATIYREGRRSRIRPLRDTLRFLRLVALHVLFRGRRMRRSPAAG